MLPCLARVDLEQWQWRGALYSPKPQHYWDLNIRLFSVISRTLVGGADLTPLQRCSQCILQPQLTGEKLLIFLNTTKTIQDKAMKKVCKCKIYWWISWNHWGCSCGVMVKAMDCGIIEREFVLQWCHYVHFRANTLGKSMNPLILPAMG